jgi:hypothetical protein
MLVNYLIQAALVTIYAIVLLMARNDFVMSKINQLSRIRYMSKLTRCLHAIPKSAKAFLDASILFAMAMLLGAMFVFGTRLNDHRKALAFLNQKWTIFLSTHTAIPALLLDLCISDSLRRRRGRLALWTMLWLFAVVDFWLWLAITVDPRSYEKPKKGAHYRDYEDSDQQLTWDYYCLSDDLWYNDFWMLVAFISVLGFFGSLQVLLNCGLNWGLCSGRFNKPSRKSGDKPIDGKLFQYLRVGKSYVYELSVT